jgi:hypothetical protein
MKYSIVIKKYKISNIIALQVFLRSVMNQKKSVIQWRLFYLFSIVVFSYSASALSHITPVNSNDSRVSRAFAALGDMYEANGLIWSGIAPQKSGKI